MPTNIIDTKPQSNDPSNLVSATINLGGAIPEDTTVKEVIVGESLLNPSVHCAVTLQSAIYNPVGKTWDRYKGQQMSLYVTDKDYKIRTGSSTDNIREMRVNQTVYRCDNRHFSSLNTGQIEDLTLHTIDDSVLKDASTIMTKSWQCTTPSQVVREALRSVGVSGSRARVTGSGPAKNYVAESIHPFQVIQQQANMALWNGDDPSYLHYMTFNENTGENIHNFRALAELIRMGGNNVNNMYTIYGADTAISGNKSFSDGYNVAVNYSFPCDYDLLSDILNGIGPQGQNLNGGNVFNLASGAVNAIGSLLQGNVASAANFAVGMTTKGTSQNQNVCDSEIEKWLIRRKARMGLLEKDKIALRVTVPWSPWLHVGNVFYFKWINRFDARVPVYGSRAYMIVHLTHNIQFGGYATTTLDCIANTLGG